MQCGGGGAEHGVPFRGPLAQRARRLAAIGANLPGKDLQRNKVLLERLQEVERELVRLTSGRPA